MERDGQQLPQHSQLGKTARRLPEQVRIEMSSRILGVRQVDGMVRALEAEAKHIDCLIVGWDVCGTVEVEEKQEMKLKNRKGMIVEILVNLIIQILECLLNIQNHQRDFNKEAT